MAYKTLKSMARNLEFQDESEAACYIMDSLINGNRSQARRLYNGLYSDQRELAYQYINEVYLLEQWMELMQVAGF